MVANWARNISTGAANEEQTLHFELTVTEMDNPSLFAVLPEVSPDGTLTFTVAPDQTGRGRWDVVLKDDGGTDNGGDDTSERVDFEIRVEANGGGDDDEGEGGD
jgi:hypothetical protein